MKNFLVFALFFGLYGVVYAEEISLGCGGDIPTSVGALFDLAGSTYQVTSSGPPVEGTCSGGCGASTYAVWNDATWGTGVFSGGVASSPEHPCGVSPNQYYAVFTPLAVVAVNDPTHCSNGIKDDGVEEGQDCGQACAALCVSSCPPGSYLFEVSSGDKCVQEYLPDNYGNCASLSHEYYPPGDYPAIGGSGMVNWPAGFCSKLLEPFLAPDSVTLPPLNSPFAATTYGEKSSSTSIVDNGDGTKTATTTTTTTTTGDDGKSKIVTDTQITTYDNDGNVISETSTTDGVKDGPSENADIIASLTGTAPGSLASIIKGNQAATNSGLSAINTNLQGVKDGLVELKSSLSTEVSDTAASDITADIDTDGDLVLDDLEQAVNDEVAGVTGDFDPGSNPFPISEGVSDKFMSIIPEPQACTPVSFTSSAGRSLTIQCKTFDTARAILGWLIGLWTISTLWEVFINTKPSGG